MAIRFFKGEVLLQENVTIILTGEIFTVLRQLVSTVSSSMTMTVSLTVDLSIKSVGGIIISIQLIFIQEPIVNQ